VKDSATTASVPPVRGATRLREIAQIRLASVRAMHALGAEQPRVLAAVDAAARGEIARDDAEALLSAHLEARERCIATMRGFDAEWRELARDASQWSPDETTAIAADAREVLALLAEIDAGDTRFADELIARRRSAGAEIARADSGRAAHRAYAGGTGASGHEPRFTDRRG
jgi:hypothetical protein